MKASSVRDWKLGDKGITLNGDIVTVKNVSDRYITIEETNIEKQVYIPSHGEIRRVSEGEKYLTSIFILGSMVQ